MKKRYDRISTYTKRVKRRRAPNGAIAYKVGATDKIRSDAERRALVYPQADNIIDLFGGVPELLEAVNAILPPDEKKWARSTIYKWTYPKDQHHGTGGEIPVRKIKTILLAARHAGVLITIDDLYPKLFANASDALLAEVKQNNETLEAKKKERYRLYIEEKKKRIQELPKMFRDIEEMPDTLPEKAEDINFGVDAKVSVVNTYGQIEEIIKKNNK